MDCFLPNYVRGKKMSPLSILILSANFGGGHVKAGEAIIEGIKSIEPAAKIIHEDGIGLISQILNTTLRKSYIKILKYSPKVWGGFYDKTREWSYDSPFQRIINSIGSKRLLSFIMNIKPDIIISTYPTVSGALAKLRMKKKLNIPLVSVITDYSVHSQWIHPGVDLNIVGNYQVHEGMVHRGIEPSQIQVSGIPVNPRFESNSDKERILKNLGLKKECLTFLIIGGAYGGLEKAQWICRYLANIKAPIQVIKVCGKDQKLFDSLDRVLEEARNPLIRFGYVSNVDELMTAADAIITKAGGLTISEALTKHLPMIIFKPIPGQEENNSLYIEEIGAGRIAHTEEQLVEIIWEWVRDPQIIYKMSCAAAQALPGHSAEKAAQAIIKLAKNNGINNT